MPPVVSNSTPIIHLAKIGHLELLKTFFGTIDVPQAVWQECTAITGKERVEIELIRNASSWINVITVHDRIIKLLRHDIDLGEAEAIALALESRAKLLLLDDSEAREKARLYRMPITGTLGILLRARKEHMIPSLKNTLKDLAASGFWISADLAEKLIAESGD